MKSTKMNIAKASILGLACFSLGYIGSSSIKPVQAQISPLMAASQGDPELRKALKNHIQNKFFKLIEASDSQKQKIDSLFSQQVAYAQPIRQEMRQKSLELLNSMSNDSVTDSEILSKLNEIHGMKDKIRNRRQKTMLKLRSLLTKEQRTVVSSKLKARLTGNPRLGLLINQ